MKKKKIILIGGPTGVGKTALSIKLAQLFGGEIISCDSIAIYKHLNIGSAKPDEEEQKQAVHHMINILEPTENYSVSEYRDTAKTIIDNLHSNGKLPIIVGGTGLYMKSLLFPMHLGASEKSEEIREKYKLIAEEKGGEELLKMLREIDPKSAEKLHAKDTLRIIRALEIYELTGTKKSEMQNELSSDYDYFLIFLNDERAKLYERINARVEKMFNLGLEEEVKNLVENYGLTKENQSMQGIGYKEFFQYFENKISKEELVEKIRLNSRHYAKRQITWFKAMPDVREFNCHNTDEIIEEIKNFLNN